MTKFHINAKGEAGLCSASSDNCPFGDDSKHYKTAEIAREAFENTQGNSFDEAEYTGPDTELTIESVLAAQLKKGDDFEGSPITSVSIGTKWVTITRESKGKTQFPKNERVAVLRELKTDAFKENENKARREEELKENIEEAATNFDTAITKFNDQVQKYGYVDYNSITRVIQTQAKKEIAERVKGRMESSNMNYTDAVNTQQEFYKENIANYLVKTGESRSTSQMSNLMDDIETDAILDFMRQANRR